MHPSVPVSLIIRSALAREGLKRILIDNGFEVRQSVAQTDAIDKSLCKDEQIVIFDSALLPADLTSALRAIIADHPGIRLVLLNDTFDFELMSQAFSAGIHAYVLHDIQFETLLSIIQLVSLGEKVAPTELIDHLRNISPTTREPDAHKFQNLTERERTILDCLIMGMPNKLISRETGVSEATVKLTIKSLFRKLEVKNRTQAAILAREANEGLQHSDPAGRRKPAAARARAAES
jgi:two-component system nitrate/nitrite response regulator NarL